MYALEPHVLDYVGYCPRCAGEQRCPCESCAISNPPGTITWIWDNAGTDIICGHCTLCLSVDEWLDIGLESQKEGVPVRHGFPDIPN